MVPRVLNLLLFNNFNSFASVILVILDDLALINNK